MTSMWVLIGLIVSAVAVSGLGAAFSIFGLAALFSSAALSVILMSAALEFAKFFIAAYLHQAWPRLRWLFKSYLSIAVVILSLITSMGIFGYLSGAYQQSSAKLEAANIKLNSLKSEQTRLTTDIDRINKSIEEIPANRISKKMNARAEAEPIIAKLSERIAKISQEMTAAELEIVDVKTHVGPLIYIAKAFDKDIDTVVKYLILVFVSVFDPLAICLVIAVSESLLSRQRKTPRKPVPQENTLPHAAPQAVQSETTPFPDSQPFAPADEKTDADSAAAKAENTDTIQMRFAKDKKVV